METDTSLRVIQIDTSKFEFNSIPSRLNLKYAKTVLFFSILMNQGLSIYLSVLLFYLYFERQYFKINLDLKERICISRSVGKDCLENNCTIFNNEDDLLQIFDNYFVQNLVMLNAYNFLIILLSILMACVKISTQLSEKFQKNFYRSVMIIIDSFLLSNINIQLFYFIFQENETKFDCYVGMVESSFLQKIFYSFKQNITIIEKALIGLFYNFLLQQIIYLILIIYSFHEWRFNEDSWKIKKIIVYFLTIQYLTIISYRILMCYFIWKSNLILTILIILDSIVHFYDSYIQITILNPQLQQLQKKHKIKEKLQFNFKPRENQVKN